MGLISKILITLIIIILFTNLLFSFYILSVNLETCNNILLESSSNQNFRKYEKKGKLLYSICFLYNNNLKECYNIYESDLFIITSAGIKIANYTSFLLNYIPEKLIIKDYRNNTICESSVNVCIEDNICNTFCNFDKDCYSEKSILDLEKVSNNIEIKDLPFYIKLAIIFAVIIIATLIWKFLK